jgi:hypothetical protein
MMLVEKIFYSNCNKLKQIKYAARGAAFMRQTAGPHRLQQGTVFKHEER